MGLLAWLRERLGLQEPEPEAEPPPEQMHWRPAAMVAEVACGEEGLLLWTSEWQHATCEECRWSGELRAISRYTNYR